MSKLLVHISRVENTTFGGQYRDLATTIFYFLLNLDIWLLIMIHQTYIFLNILQISLGWYKSLNLIHHQAAL